MNLRKELKAEGIILEVAPGDVSVPETHHLDCPKSYCKKQRGPEDSTPLKLEIISKDYAEWRCRHCLWTGHVGGKNPRAHEPAPEVKAPDLSSIKLQGDALLPEAIHKYFLECGVSDAVLQQNKIFWMDDRKMVAFPYHEAGQRINMMVMDVQDQKTRLASGRNISFYGLDQVVKSDGYELIIAHREMDRLLLLTLGFKNVIAIPNGGVFPSRQDEYGAEPAEFEYFAAAADMLLGAKKIVIAVDNTSEGEQIRQELARRVGLAKCFIVEFGEKTLRSTIAKRGMDYACEDMHLAKPHPIRGLFEVTEFLASLEEYFLHGMTSGVSTGWENVDKLFTILIALNIITGIPNSGKSEWLDALMVNLAMLHGQRTAYYSPENTKEGHVTKIVEKKVQLSSNPKSQNRMSVETLMSGAAWVSQYFYFIVSDIMGEPATIDWILDRGADAVMRFGIKNLVIDPWNRIHHMMGSQSETDYIRQALIKILQFKVNHGVSVWLVIHPTKQEPDRKTGLFPPPSLYSCAGSAHFVNMCDNGFTIHRKSGKSNITEVHVKKVRDKHVGVTGKANLVYDTETGRYEPEPDTHYSQGEGYDGDAPVTHEAE